MESLSFKRLFERIRHPDGMRFVGDSGIVRLLEKLPRADPLHAILCGDVLFRLWLYKASRPENLLRAADQHFSPGLRLALNTCAPHDPPDGAFDEGAEFDEKAIGHFRATARQFLRSDGLIGLLVGPDDVVPIPFSLVQGGAQGLAVIDIDGKDIPEWTRILSSDPSLGPVQGLRLNVRIGGLAEKLDGRSFGLPAIFARAKMDGRLPEFRVLDILATGSIHHGKLEMVDGLEAKLELARKIGAVFVGPGTHGEGIFLSVGCDVASLLDQTTRELERRMIGKLSPQQAASALAGLQKELHGGGVGLDEASRRVDRILGFCEGAEETDVFSSEARLRGAVLRASIANHRGKGEIAQAELARIKDSAKRNHEIYLHILASEVVSLTDGGYTDEAVQVGRGLLQWVEEEMNGGAEDLKKAKMTASGVLGGQALLVIGLQNPEMADESLSLLKRALDAARSLNDHKEISRDAVQIVLWHALHAPATIDIPLCEALAILAKDPQASATSADYLYMYRFLGAYRRLLFHDGHIAGDFDSWNLPQQSTGASGWVLAMTLKYRGSLLVATGRCDAARRDFEMSLSLLENEESALLQLIGGTSAIEAAIRLPVAKGCAERFRAAASRLFCNPAFPPSAEWLDAVENSTPNNLESATFELRKNCRY